MLENDDLFNTVVKAGWHSTGIGLQSGSWKIAHDMYGRNYSNEEYIAYAKKLFDNDVSACIHIIGGNPYETEDDFEQTIKVLRQLPYSLTEPFKNFIHIFRLKPHPGTPLLKRSPKIITNPLSAVEWLYRAALYYLCRIMSEDDFAEIREQKFYKQRPDVLLAIYRHLFEQKQLSYYRELAKKYEGKPVIFYGCGEIYNFNQHIFNGCKVQAMLLDKSYLGESSTVNGLPMLDVARVNEFDNEIPIVIFATDGTIMRRNLHLNYGIDRSRIHVCSTHLQTSASAAYYL